MTDAEARNRALSLVEAAEICLLGTVGAGCTPHIKAAIRAVARADIGRTR
jgi:hypothetical protein